MQARSCLNGSSEQNWPAVLVKRCKNGDLLNIDTMLTRARNLNSNYVQTLGVQK